MTKFKLFAWDEFSGLMEIIAKDKDNNWLGGITENSFPSKKAAIEAYNDAEILGLRGRNVPDGLKNGIQKGNGKSDFDVLVVSS
jgi:hypothetical protein